MNCHVFLLKLKSSGKSQMKIRFIVLEEEKSVIPKFMCYNDGNLLVLAAAKL